MAKRNPFAAIAHGHDLAEAIVDAIREPLLVLDPDLRVIAASRSFYRTFRGDATQDGRPIGVRPGRRAVEHPQGSAGAPRRHHSKAPDGRVL